MNKRLQTTDKCYCNLLFGEIVDFQAYIFPRYHYQIRQRVFALEDVEQIKETLRPVEGIYRIVHDKYGFHVETPQYIWVPYRLVERVEDTADCVNIWLTSGWVKLWKTTVKTHTGFKSQ